MTTAQYIKCKSGNIYFLKLFVNIWDTLKNMIWEAYR